MTQQAAFDLQGALLDKHDAQNPQPAQPKLKKRRSPLGSPSSHMAVRRDTLAAKPAVVPIRRQPITPRGAIAESAVAFLWLLGWALNGLSTVSLGWLPFVNWFASRLGHGDALWLSYWLQIPAGIVIHIVISRIEQDLWRQTQPPEKATIEQRMVLLLSSIRTWEAVVIGSIDSLTAALGVLFFCSAFGLGASLTLVLIGGLFGTALAMVVEPMLKYHGQALQRMLWRR